MYPRTLKHRYIRTVAYVRVSTIEGWYITHKTMHPHAHPNTLLYTERGERTRPVSTLPASPLKPCSSFPLVARSQDVERAYAQRHPLPWPLVGLSHGVRRSTTSSQRPVGDANKAQVVVHLLPLRPSQWSRGHNIA